MILAVTMNPSVDISYPLERFLPDTVNRVENPGKTAGGKGLNVARVACILGADVLATGFVGGHLGAFIKEQLSQGGIAYNFCEIKQESRNCIAILHDGGQQTEILESGPVLSSEEEEAFKKHFTSLLPGVDVITISGSLPKGINPGLYSWMIACGNQNKIPILLDTSGATLKQSLQNPEKPFLIKPNREELQQLTHEPVSADIHSLKKVLAGPLIMDIPYVVVSLGGTGAFAKVYDHFYKVEIPEVIVKNPVGSGDATIAGMAVAIEKKEPVEQVLKMGMMAGILNAMESQTGMVNMENAEKILADIQVHRV